MARRNVATEKHESFRPLTQILVGAIEVMLDEIAALRGLQAGPWILALEERVAAVAEGLETRGLEANATQVAQSALRECFREMRSQLY